MKKILTIFLCGMLLFSVPACKQETVTYPTVVTKPGATESVELEKPEQEKEEPQDSTAGTGGQTVQIGSGKPEATPETETPETETPETETAEVEQPEVEQPEAEAPAPEVVAPERTFAKHPLVLKNGSLSKTTASSIALSDLVKGGGLKTLKKRTLTLYTAGDAPSFHYLNEKGVLVSEWDWMKELAKENDFTLKLVRKTNASSLKAQRIALNAGQELSLVSLRKEELASGMTLCRSASKYLNAAATPNGISRAVLSQSNDTLFAPIGNIEALWYHLDLMPEKLDPNALYKNNQWNAEAYTKVHTNALAKKVMPLLMETALPWATLSGRSPLTLLDGKLDSNIHAQVTQIVWGQLRELNGALTPFKPAKNTTYTFADETVAMTYSSIPAAGKGSYSFAPLPILGEEQESTVTYCGNFLALPKYREEQAADLAALTFAELWCNRYAEALAADFKALDLDAAAYADYLALAAGNGSLIFYDASIEAIADAYLSGLTDEKVDMAAEYEKIRTKLLGTVAKYNQNY